MFNGKQHSLGIVAALNRLFKPIETAFPQPDAPMKIDFFSYLFCILINSFGCAIIFPHVLHLETSNGLYMGIRTLTLGSGLSGLTKILFTETLFQ